VAAQFLDLGLDVPDPVRAEERRHRVEKLHRLVFLLLQRHQRVVLLGREFGVQALRRHVAGRDQRPQGLVHVAFARLQGGLASGGARGGQISKLLYEGGIDLCHGAQLIARFLLRLEVPARASQPLLRSPSLSAVLHG
jgi:hypothetical protein